MTVREKLLEEKIVVLEKRLALLERFVELRFCETFQDFRVRNSKGKTGAGSQVSSKGPPSEDDDDDEDDNNKNNYKDRATPKKSESVSSRRSHKSGTTTQTGGKGKGAPASIKAQRDLKKRELVIELEKLPNMESPDTPRYGTRRQTRIAQAPVIKEEVTATDSGADDDFQPAVESYGDFDNTEQSPEEREDSYFTYPGDGADEDDSLEKVKSIAGHDADRDWSCGEDMDDNDDNAEEYKPPKSIGKEKGVKRKASSLPTYGPRKKPGPKVIPGRLRKKQYKTSVKDISQDTEIVSTDPTRAECPICRQHWKLEMLETHIASHGRERHLKCPHCDKHYSQTGDLRHHIRHTHNRDTFPKCRICGVPQTKKMILHEKYCVKRALSKGEHVEPALVQKIREQCAKEGLEFVLPDETVPEGLDPGERVECPNCKKHFQRRHIQKHVASHSLPRNWKCSKCPKTYIHKHDLIRHVALMHEMELKCDSCGAGFETKQDLMAHNVKCRKDKGLPEIATGSEEEEGGVVPGAEEGNQPEIEPGSQEEYEVVQSIY